MDSTRARVDRMVPRIDASLGGRSRWVNDGRSGAAPHEVPAHVRLLREQPVVTVQGCPGIVAHQATDVFDLWQRWEALTSSRQEPPFWAAVWPGAAVLCQLFFEESERVEARRVVDFGCGSGVVALAAKRVGAAAVLAVDEALAAVDAARVNAELNSLRVETQVGAIDSLQREFGRGDVLTLSEMFYDEPTSRRLGALADAAVARGASVLIADGERKFLPRERVRSLRHAVVDVDASLEGVGQRRVGVFEWVS